jgi:TetR/AcrR family transcriptional regulator
MPNATFFNLPESKRTALIDCALEEFAANDYNSASISRIVAQLGIAKGSLYQYFTDKADLYHYLLTLAAEKKAELLRQASPPADQTVFSTLAWLFTEMSRYQALYPRYAALADRALRENNAHMDAAIRDASAGTAHYFTQLLDAAQARGELRAGADTAAAALLLTGALHALHDQLEQQSLTSQSPETYLQAARDWYMRLLAVLRSGIAPTAEN